MSMPSNDTTDARKPVDMGPGAPLNGDVQESVDPFDYAETIVRDLALHVGSRLRDFRSDLAAMHSAVVQLPETMKINALGQSIQELRERLAHLTGVVSQQVTRYPEELDRVAKVATELMNRVAGLESWIAAARQSMAQGDMPNLPIPTGGFIGHDQFNVVVGQVHDSILRVVGAVRDLQLDVRDIRTDIRTNPAANGSVAPAPAVAGPDHGPALADLARRLTAVESRPVLAAVAPVGPPPDLAALVFGAWNRLAQPPGDEALRQSVESVLTVLAPRFDSIVRQPQVAKGSGLVAVANGKRGGTALVALLATEDLCGRAWALGAHGGEMRSEEEGDKPSAIRTPCWRALLAAVALVEQASPGARVLPILVYGHGSIDAVPSRDDMAAYGRRLGVGAAADRLVTIAAADQNHAGLGQPQDLAAALQALGV